MKPKLVFPLQNEIYLRAPFVFDPGLEYTIRQLNSLQYGL